MLTVLCELSRTEELIDLIFAETTTFGVRIERITRWKLTRHFEKIATSFGEITMKIGMRDGRVIQAMPEFESCREAAGKSRQPLRTIYAAALVAWENSG